MKKIVVISLICAIALSFAAPVFALPDPVKKLTRGVANIISAPLEIGKQMTNEWRAADVKHLAFFGGIFKGLAYAVKRVGSGLIDVLTFPIKLKEDYEPLMKPEYVFDN